MDSKNRLLRILSRLREMPCQSNLQQPHWGPRSTQLRLQIPTPASASASVSASVPHANLSPSLHRSPSRLSPFCFSAQDDSHTSSQHPVGSVGLYEGGGGAKKEGGGEEHPEIPINQTIKSVNLREAWRKRLRAPMLSPSHPQASPSQHRGTPPPPYPRSGNLTSFYILPGPPLGYWGGLALE